MSFFDSDIVRAEMTEISELQEEIYRNVFKFPHMSKDEKLSHVDLLDRLLDKQKILYARLSFSDDPEAIEMRNQIIESAKMMGAPSDVDMNAVFTNMSNMLESMRKQIDKTGSDL